MINFDLKLAEQDLFYDEDEKLVFSLNYLNCLNSKIFLYIKNFFPDQNNIFSLFIEDIGFTIVKDSRDHIIDFGSSYYMNIKYNDYFSIHKDLFNIKKNTFRSGHEAMNYIEDKILKNDLLIISTCIERLTYHTNFVSLDFPFEGHENEFRHYILIVGSDKDNLYFIDNPITCDFNNYKYYKNYKNIGRIKKEEIIYAFDAFCEAFSLDIDVKSIEDQLSIKLLYKRLYENHYSKTQQKNAIKIIKGKTAYQELLQLLERYSNNNSNLMKLLKNKNSFENYFSWQIYDLIALRNLTIQVINENKNLEKREKIEKIKILMNYQIFFLKKAHEILNNKENIGQISDKILVIFKKVIELEDQIFLKNELES